MKFRLQNIKRCTDQWLRVRYDVVLQQLVQLVIGFMLNQSVDNQFMQIMLNWYVEVSQ